MVALALGRSRRHPGRRLLDALRRSISPASALSQIQNTNSVLRPREEIAMSTITFFPVESPERAACGERIGGQVEKREEFSKFMRRVVSHTQGVMGAMECPQRGVGSETPRIIKWQALPIRGIPPLQPSPLANHHNRNFSSGCAIKKAQIALTRNDRRERRIFVYLPPTIL